MAYQGKYASGVDQLRDVLSRFKPGQRTYDEIVAPRDAVLAKYRPIFSCESVPAMTREQFTSFLYF